MEHIVERSQLGPCLDKNSSMNTVNHYRYIANLAGKQERLLACPVPCKQRTYPTEMLEFHENSFGFIDPENTQGDIYR
jgi:hypothetical protein